MKKTKEQVFAQIRSNEQRRAAREVQRTSLNPKSKSLKITWNGEGPPGNDVYVAGLLRKNLEQEQARLWSDVWGPSVLSLLATTIFKKGALDGVRLDEEEQGRDIHSDSKE